MADWQVEFVLVPRRVLATVPRLPLFKILEGDWWTSVRLPSNLAIAIGSIAPSAPSSTKELQTWGTEEGSRIDLWLQDGRPARMSARVDVRRLDASFGAKLLQFAKIANAVLIRRDGLVIEPSVGAFGAALRSSDAWKYAVDPAAHLASYADDETDE